MNKLNFPTHFQDNLHSFIESLQKEDENFLYFPTNIGLTQDGKNLSLGFSTYVLKLFYMTGLWDDLSKPVRDKWIENINSYQKNHQNLPINSYIDQTLLNFYKKPPISKKIKNSIKKQLSFLSTVNYYSLDVQLLNAIRAETKQAISTIHQVGYKNTKPYLEFPKSESEIISFLESFDWSKPWDAGANFSSICVFSNTQLPANEYQNNKEVLYKFASKIVDKETGSYFIGKTPSETELINGAMKVITGMDWLNVPIHEPEKLIDYCLGVVPKNEGCDIVDLVYVLFKCSEQTNYKKNEIILYMIDIYKLIFDHYFKDYGGFSYYLNKSQMYYSGLIISEGKSTPDIHGTLLLCWAISMIDKISESNNLGWNIIKP